MLSDTLSEKAELWEQTEAMLNQKLNAANYALTTTLHILSFSRKGESLSLLILLTSGLFRYESSVRVWGYKSMNSLGRKLAILLYSAIASKIQESLSEQLYLSWTDGEKRIRVTLK